MSIKPEAREMTAQWKEQCEWTNGWCADPGICLLSRSDSDHDIPNWDTTPNSRPPRELVVRATTSSIHDHNNEPKFPQRWSE